MNAPAAEKTDDTRLIRVAVQAALDRKAEELTVLELGEISDFTEHFLICSGSNERQVQAIADAVLKNLRDEKRRPLHVEGLQARPLDPARLRWRNGDSRLLE